jgi:predicted DNA-binding transcriptional regulator AlpA
MNSDRLELAKLAFMGLNKTERRQFLATFSEPVQSPATNSPAVPATDRLLRRGEVAAMLARSPRAVDRLAVDGTLPKFTLPGRLRAAGFRLADVQRLIGGR